MFSLRVLRLHFARITICFLLLRSSWAEIVCAVCSRAGNFLRTIEEEWQAASVANDLRFDKRAVLPKEHVDVLLWSGWQSWSWQGGVLYCILSTDWEESWRILEKVKIILNCSNISISISSIDTIPSCQDYEKLAIFGTVWPSVLIVLWKSVGSKGSRANDSALGGPCSSWRRAEGLERSGDQGKELSETLG